MKMFETDSCKRRAVKMSVTKKAEAKSGLSVHYAGGGLWVAAKSWAQAQDSVKWALGRQTALEGIFESCPFQVADSRHSQRCAGELVREWLKSQGAW